MTATQRHIARAIVGVICAAGLGIGCTPQNNIPPPGEPDDRPPIIVGNGGSIDLVAAQADDGGTGAVTWAKVSDKVYDHKDANTASHGGPVNLSVLVFSSDCDMLPTHVYTPTDRVKDLTITYAIAGSASTPTVKLEVKNNSGDKFVEATFDEAPSLTNSDSTLAVGTTMWALKKVDISYLGGGASNKTTCNFKGVPSADGIVILQRHK